MTVAMVLAVPARSARGEDGAPWPRWEAGGQLSLLAAGGEVALRALGLVGRHFGRHEAELRLGASHVLSATAVDIDAAYAVHARWRSLLGFIRGGAGTRIEHIGGGIARARLALMAGAGLKVRATATLALRTDVEYRHLTGAPGVADEIALLVGPVALW